jgi:rhodanese-related sulfurtransferase
MKFRSIAIAGIISISSAVILSVTPSISLADNHIAAPHAANIIDGKVKTVVNKSNTISLDVEKKGVVVFKATAETKFVNAKALKNFVAGEEVAIEFKIVGSEMVAVVIKKVIAELPKGTSPITFDELKVLSQKGPKAGNFVMFDSRPAGRYHQGHIPGATSLPFAAMKKADEEGKLAAMLPPEKDKLLIFYCGGITCVLSPNSAKLAVKAGYTNVKVFAGGEPEWSEKDQPLESSPKFVKEDNIVLIDLRTADKFATGHIAKAINIPIEDLKNKWTDSQFPEYKGAYIVFTSDKMPDMLSALDQMKDWSFSKATIFTGGMERWTKAEIPVAYGAAPAPAKLTYVRKLAPFEVSIDEFKKAMATKSALIIDARSTAEYAAGKIDGAVNIPSEEMEKRFAEVPKDKPVYLHCSTGARAEMAFDILKAKKFENIKVLKANVEFKNGKLVIKE